ncbi:MAG: putative iron-regulated protein [Paraglaciecola psychrophila]|jgi:putative iron-regulated protein
MNAKYLTAGLITLSCLTACGGGGSSSSSPPVVEPPAPVETDVINLENVSKVLESNADIALAAYSDSVDTAQALHDAIDNFSADTSQQNLDLAKQAWLVSREPYGQTEVYRFRMSPIDSSDGVSEDGLEGDINAWPLGEALIDYVVTSPGTNDDFEVDQVGVTANSAGIADNGAVDGSDQNINIIASTVTIDQALLANTATAEDEHDVIAGYHAIEFMLWGQDLNNAAQVTVGTDRDTAVKTLAAANIAAGGQRPLTDFTTAANAPRRLLYMQMVADKLVADLTVVRSGWEDGVADNYRDRFTAVADRAEAISKLTEILTGMGTLSEGELAGERMQISFSANSQEDEHSCFSDNTHRDIWLNAEGISNSYYGDYAGYDSSLDGVDNESTRAVSGYGLDDYIVDLAIADMTTLATSLDTALTATEVAYTRIDSSARAGSPVDVLIMDINRNEDNPMYETIITLNQQSSLIADLAVALDIADTVVDDDASGCDTSAPNSTCP